MSQPLRSLLLTAIVACAAFQAAYAQNKLVVPFPPGGGSSFVAHQLAESLPKTLGEPVEIVHRPGRDGTFAVETVARGAPDGKTLLIGSSSSMLAAPLADGRGPFDPIHDFALIGVIGTVPRMVVVHPSLPVRNLDELIRLARESPDKLACGMGDRLSEHAVRLFERHAGVQLHCVPYEGVGPLREAMLSGQRKLAFESAYLPEVQGGRLRALAIAAPTRMKALPQVPTASEAGLPALDVRTWLALFAPKGTDAARVERLGEALAATLRDPRVAAALESRGYVVRPMSIGQARNYLEVDLALWRRVAASQPTFQPRSALVGQDPSVGK